MIKDKYKTFKKALIYSYQGVDVQKENEQIQWRALINPDKNKFDYDDKILSIDYEAGFQPGDVFEWLNTNTHWLIYLQELTEDAYFRAEIRECKYQIKYYNDSDELITTWTYIRGPVETKINFIQKKGISIDKPNFTLHIYMPQTEDNKKFFKRYAVFMFDDTAWQVQTVDSVSTKGIIEITAKEHYINNVLDDQENNIANAFEVVPAIEEEPQSDHIVGEIFIKPTTLNNYEIVDINEDGYWAIKEANRPVEIKEENDNVVSLIWNKTLSGSFTLQYITNNEIYEKYIVVESLF